MTFAAVRGWLYFMARVLGDFTAILGGRVGQRIARRLAGRLVGRWLWRWFR